MMSRLASWLERSKSKNVAMLLFKNETTNAGDLLTGELSLAASSQL
jgi:hypothetical protein